MDNPTPLQAPIKPPTSPKPKHWTESVRGFDLLILTLVGISIVIGGLTFLRTNQLYTKLNPKWNGSLGSQAEAESTITRADVSIEDDDPTIGPADAPVQVVEFSDFECPFCGQFAPSVKSVLEDYGDQIQFAYKDFPLDFHEQALPAATAAQCVFEQAGSKAFFSFHDGLFADQENLGDDLFFELAEQIDNLDVETFRDCYKAQATLEEVQDDFNDGQLAGVTGTPATFVNGRLVSGADPAGLRRAIDEELNK